jgi:hypothetical protein
MVLGDDQAATVLAQALAGRIAGCRGIYAGRPRNAGQVEAFTANLAASTPGTVQAWMSHESIATTNRYLHFLRTSADQADVDRLNDPSRGPAAKPDVETEPSDRLGRSTREALRSAPTSRGYAGRKRDGPAR